MEAYLATSGKTSSFILGFTRKTLLINRYGLRFKTLHFAPINSTFYRKNNLDKICPYNSLEHDISNLRNECNILLLGNFNARTTTSQAIILSNDSNPNPLWLDAYLFLDGRYKRSSKDLNEKLFGYILIKLHSSQDIIIFIDLMKWSKSNQMTFIHEHRSTIMGTMWPLISPFATK